MLNYSNTYSDHLNNIRGVLPEISEDIPVLAELIRNSKDYCRFCIFSPLECKVTFEYKASHSGTLLFMYREMILPLIGPFGLAASSLGVLASERRRNSMSTTLDLFHA